MLYWLASYPRSGNSFFRRIVEQCYGLVTWDKYIVPSETDPNYPLLRSLETIITSPQPVLVKTHEPPGDDNFPAVYLLRDGRDALVSYTHFVLTLDKPPKGEITPVLFHNTLRDLLLEERSPFRSWAENVLAWTSRPGVVVVRYEELVQNPGPVVERALRAIGCPTKRIKDEIPTFEQLKKKNPLIFRRGLPGCWRDEFPPDLLPLFWERNGYAMERFGYSREETRRVA